MTLDMRTVLIFSFVNYFVGVLCMYVLWHQNRRQFKGIALWVLDMGLQILSVLLLLLRGAIPDVLSIVLANTLVASGMVVLQIGMERFLECRWPRWQNYLLIPAVFGLFYYFGVVSPDLQVRNFIASGFALYTSAQTAWILLFRSGKAHRWTARLTGATLLGYSAVSLGRIVLLLAAPSGTTDFFRSQFLEVLPIALLVALTTLLTVSLVLLVNVRLVEARAAEEEKFALAFQSAPYAIGIIRFSDGRIQEVNEGFAHMTGIAVAEAVGRTTVELGLWPSDADRQVYIDRLRTTRRLDNVPVSMKKKNGEPLEILMSARLLSIRGEDMLVSSMYDVTERQKTQRLLEESEAKYRSVFDNSMVGQSLTLPSGEIQINRTMVDMLGYTPEEFEAKTWQEITHPDDIESTQRHVDALVAGKVHTARFEKRYLKKDGSVVWADLLTSIRKDPSENHPYFMTSIVDITEQKRAQDALRESQAILMASFENSTAGIAIADAPDGHLRYVNQAGLAIRAKSETELVKGDFHDYADRWNVFHFDGTPYRSEDIPLARAIRLGEMCSDEFLIRRDDQEDRDVLANASPVRDEHGNVIAGVVVFLDITDRRRAEAALHESEERLELAMQAGGMGVWQYDFARQKRIFDARTCRLLGLDPATFRGTAGEFYGCMVPEDAVRTRALLERTRVTGALLETDYQVVWPDGSRHWIASRGRLSHATGAPPSRIAGLCWDITGEKLAEGKRRNAEIQLRQQQKLEAIGTLAAGVAHEINNPLTGILNYAQLVLDDAVPSSPEASYLQGIIDESQRVSKIVSNLLQFSRQEKQSHSYARIDDIIDRTVSLVRTIIKKDRIDLQVDVPEGLPEVKCRSQQIQQVVMNLLTNARDALNEKYPGADPDKVVRLVCRSFEAENRRWIRISVEDHGTGITPEVRQKIFEPFYSTKPKDRGTGLGLAISHGIVSDHHGYFEIDSEPGRYSTVSVVLPVDNGWDHPEGE